jgi:hypothetical protein
MAANIRVAPEQPDVSTVIDGERKTVTALAPTSWARSELMAISIPKKHTRLSIPR